MSKKKAKVGDEVLVYGNRLKIIEIKESGANVVARCEDASKRADREAATQEERDFIAENNWRNFETDASGTKEEKVAAYKAKLAEIRKRASEALYILSLRVDLLRWWDEESAWVSDGRILSDDQKAEWLRKFGKKPLGVVVAADGSEEYPEREAFTMLTQGV